MQLTTIALALATVVPSTLAGWIDMSVPKTIVLGKPFNITGHFTPVAPSTIQSSITLSTMGQPPDLSGIAATLGSRIGAPGERQGGYAAWHPNVIITSNDIDKGKPFYLQYLAFTVSGPGPYLSAEVVNFGPMQAGSAISSEVITVTTSSDRWRTFPLKDC